MLDYQLLLQNQYKSMPWKNGLGKTLEIQRCDDQHGLRFRISQASVVEDGLFSDFSGLHRTLVILSGNAIALKHTSDCHSNTHVLDNLLDIARFSGGDKTYASLQGGKIEDLNIMVRERDTHAMVSALVSGQSLNLSNPESPLLTAFYANDFCSINLDINVVASGNISLPANSLLLFKAPKALMNKQLLMMDGSGVLIKISGKVAVPS
ncbi:MAG: HutD family protein [Psychromonas sp.]